MALSNSAIFEYRASVSVVRARVSRGQHGGPEQDASLRPNVLTSRLFSGILLRYSRRRRSVPLSHANFSFSFLFFVSSFFLSFFFFSSFTLRVPFNESHLGIDFRPFNRCSGVSAETKRGAAHAVPCFPRDRRARGTTR